MTVIMTIILIFDDDDHGDGENDDRYQCNIL